MTPNRHSGYAAAACALVVGWLVFTWPWISGKVTIPYDAKAHFQAQLQFLANALHSGQSPFWTPNVFGGSPQVADPQSLIFAPAVLLAYFDSAPSFREFDSYCFLLLGMAAAAVLMYFRDRNWHPAGAVVAALGVAFGGSSIWRIQHIKQIESFAFFVLAFWLLSRALERRSIVYGVLAGLASGLMVIEPGQVAMIGCYVLVGFVAYHWLTSPDRYEAVKQSVKPLAGGAAVASVLATVPILLSYLFVKASSRAEIPFEEAVRGSLHPASLLTGVIADLYGAHDPLVTFWGPGSGEWQANWLSMSENMSQIYIGALPIVALLLLGLSRRAVWDKEIRFVTLSAAALFIYALGRYTPLFRVLYDVVPGVHLFRRPADATYALCAMAAILSGYLVHRYLSGEPGAGRSLRHYIGGALLLVIFAAGTAIAVWRGHLDEAIKPLFISMAFTAGAAALLPLLRRLSREHAAAAVLCASVFMVGDLVVNNGPNPSTAQPPSNYDMLRVDTKNETIKFLKAHLCHKLPSARRDRVEMVGLGFEWPNVSLIHGFDHVLGYNPVRLDGIVHVMGTAETVADPWQRQFTPLFPSYRSMTADLLGLRYIVLNMPIEKLDKKLRPGDLRLITNSKNTYIYENPRALPRVLFVAHFQTADFVKIEKDGRWPSFDPTHTVLLEETPPFREEPVSLVSQNEGTAVLLRYENTDVEIEVDAKRPGFVVLNDIWHPWWFARVDGEPARIRRANVMFRAVQVPAGKHRVTFEFRPLEGAFAELETDLKPGALPVRADQKRSPEPKAPVGQKTAGTPLEIYY